MQEHAHHRQSPAIAGKQPAVALVLTWGPAVAPLSGQSAANGNKMKPSRVPQCKPNPSYGQILSMDNREGQSSGSSAEATYKERITRNNAIERLFTRRLRKPWTRLEITLETLLRILLETLSREDASPADAPPADAHREASREVSHVIVFMRPCKGSQCARPVLSHILRQQKDTLREGCHRTPSEKGCPMTRFLLDFSIRRPASKPGS